MHCPVSKSGYFFLLLLVLVSLGPHQQYSGWGITVSNTQDHVMLEIGSGLGTCKAYDLTPWPFGFHLLENHILGSWPLNST